MGPGGSLIYVDREGRKWHASDIRDCEVTGKSGIRRVYSMYPRGCSYYTPIGPSTFEMKITFSKLVIEEPEKKPQEIKNLPELIRVIR